MSSEYRTPEQLAEIAEKAFGKPKTFRLDRDGDRDLTFTGWEIGKGERNAHSITLVKIYLTKGQNLVTQVQTLARQDKSLISQTVGNHNTAPEALDWLKEDNGDSLGSASKTAWEEACRAWPPIAEYETETFS